MQFQLQISDTQTIDACLIALTLPSPSRLAHIYMSK